MTGLIVRRPGLATTVQDRGRFGYQRLGVPTCGAIDADAYAIANALVGNEPGAAALEIRLLGPKLEVGVGSAIVALAGGTAPFAVTSNGVRRTVPAGSSTRVVRGDTLDIAAIAGSATAYLAVRGGINVPLVLGSRSTFLRGPFGGLEGRVLKTGDVLPLALPDAPAEPERALRSASTLLAVPKVLHVVLGPQDDMFTAAGIETFLNSEYKVTNEADRMGIRFAGEKLEHKGTFDIVSDGIAAGAIQVPGSGLPILLLADRQTTGGYPKIATVVSADVPAAGRLKPGETIRFAALDIAAAEKRTRSHAQALAAALRHLAATTVGMIDEEALYSTDLSGGEALDFDAED